MTENADERIRENVDAVLRVQLSAGHGGVPTTTRFIDERADAYAFLLESLGMKSK